MSYYMPILILIVSNVTYQICSKETPAAINPLAMLTITYAISAVCCLILYYALHMGDGLLAEYSNFNWAGIIMALAIVGMEVGTIYMYKVGWKVSSGLMFSSTIVAVCLLILGIMVYKEVVTTTKILGVMVCLVGLYLINKN